MAEPGDSRASQDPIPGLVPDTPEPEMNSPAVADAWPESGSEVRPDAETPDTDVHDPHANDDLVGFTSVAALSGLGRAQDPASEPELDFERPIPDAGSAIHSWPEALPAWARETPPPPKPAPTFGRAARKPPQAEGALGLYAVYALILFAVPTGGFSALIALLAVYVRPTPDEPIARSHFIFQKHTLLIAAVAGLIGILLIVVNLGVFILFIMAVWVLVRGAWGVITLIAGKAIANPRQWLIQDKQT